MACRYARPIRVAAFASARDEEETENNDL